MRNLMRSTSVVLLSLSLTGTAVISARAAELPPRTPKVVAAFHDTGINPYHQVFRTDDPWAHEHPSTYIEGYPTDAIALPITLPAADAEVNWATVVQEDCLIWKSVQPGKLYWFPGTKIIGAVSFSASMDGACSSLPNSGTEILDYNGHGTMVASRGTGAGYGACRESDCRIVAVQSPMAVPIVNPASSMPPTVAGIDFITNNAGWIDVQSNSWGPIVPGWEPTGQAGLLTANPELVRAVERASSTHPAFWASGNGILFRGGVLGHPTLLTPHLGPSAIIVGGHDSGFVNTWPGFPPHVVSDSCAAWAARNKHLSQSADNVASGTSGATPYAAGGAARILLEARQILGDLDTGVDAPVATMAQGSSGVVSSGPLADGTLHRDELKDLLFNTATPRPARQFEDGPPCSLTAGFDPTPVKWTDVPAQYPEFLHIGYGAVDTPSINLAFQVLRGTAGMPNRATTDLYFGEDYRARTVTHSVWDGIP
jgi:hypothetical protein